MSKDIKEAVPWGFKINTRKQSSIWSHEFTTGRY